MILKDKNRPSSLETEKELKRFLQTPSILGEEAFKRAKKNLQEIGLNMNNGTTYISVLKQEIKDLAFNYYMVRYYIQEMRNKISEVGASECGLDKELILLKEQRDDLERLIDTTTKILQLEKGK